MLALKADVRRALARSAFYMAEFVEKHSHNITVALSSAGILGDRGHASVTDAALTIPGVPIFCFGCDLRQWRRGACRSDYNTTSD